MRQALPEGDGPIIFVIYYDSGRLVSIEPRTGQIVGDQSLAMHLEQLLSVEVLPESNSLLILEGPGCCGGIIAGENQIWELDFDTGISELVFEGRNIVGVKRLSTSDLLLLSYYDPSLDDIRLAARDGQAQHCFLDMETHLCTDLSILSEYDSVGWLRPSQLVGSVLTGTFSPSSFVINMYGPGRLELPRPMYSWVLIPGTETILANTGARNLSLIDLATMYISTFELAGDYDYGQSLHPVSIAPDGNFVLIQNGANHLIVEFGLREVVSVLPNSSFPLWISNDTLVYVSFPRLGSYPGEIRRRNVITRADTTLLEFSEQVSIKRFP
ncbi:MAG: hypothetical protein IPK19_25210 [Chloroflexi bacterium]|nr:hypothetical protein [Chloroflexota bacterium]